MPVTMSDGSILRWRYPTLVELGIKIAYRSIRLLWLSNLLFRLARAERIVGQKPEPCEVFITAVDDGRH